jgi:hypothetical protein
MLGSLATFVKFSFLIAVALVFFIAATAYAINVLCRALSTGVVQVGKFGDLNPSNNNTDRAPYLLARAEELAKPVPLDALYEVKVPPLTSRFGVKDDLKFLDDVKINIQGVNLPDVIKNLFAALPDDQPIVSATPETVASGSAARLEWKEPSGKKKSWLLRSNKLATDAEATRQIIDQAIYAMVYYMHYDPTGPGPPPKGVQFSSERALEAYYSGQQHLSVYQRKRGSTEVEDGLKDLDEAEKRFRVLYQEMPNFTDGLMLLGVTLLEQNNESEAIVIFERIKQNLLREGAERAQPQAAAPVQAQAQAAALEKLKPEEKKAFFSAKLFQATAQRKLYRVKDNHLALAEIDDIIAKIAPLHAAPVVGAPETPEQKTDRLDFLKIHISVLAEKAYVLGLYLVLLNEVNFIEGLQTTPPAPAGQPAPKNPPAIVALTVDSLTALVAIEERIKAGGAGAEQAKKERLAEYRAKIETIYQMHKTVVTEATDFIKSVPSNDDTWKGARERFRSDLNNAAGYAQYRHAQAVKDVEDNDEPFLTECKNALDSLHEAYAVHQNEQTILLNLGLVESDPRCDPKGKNIERARKYLKQASATKPMDYYAQQLLAALGIREIYTWGPFAKPDVLTDAVAAADRARTLRPEDGTIFALLAQAYILQWAQASDAQRNEVRPKIEAAIAQAAKRKATPIHLHTVQLQWLVTQAAKSSGDFNNFKTTLGVKIDAAIADAKDDSSWYGHQLLKDANALKSQLSALEAGKQSSLHWPN